MTDLRMIADKLGKPRATFTLPRERDKESIDLSFEAISRYPTITILLFMAISGVVVVMAAASLIAFLILASLR